MNDAQNKIRNVSTFLQKFKIVFTLFIDGREILDMKILTEFENPEILSITDFGDPSAC